MFKLKRQLGVPRFRMFAGPNGSGKSTIKGEIAPELIKIYVNADELEKEAKATCFIGLTPFGISTILPELLAFHAEYYLIKSKELNSQTDQICLSGFKGRRFESHTTHHIATPKQPV